jgi:hypothetical protein
MEGILKLVISAERYSNKVQADRTRCQIVYPVVNGSCYSDRCGKRAEFKCAECGLSLCRPCVEMVAFDPYCQSCAELQKVFLAALVAGLKKPKIVTSHVFPPIPIRSYDWCAYDDNTYDGPGSIIGHGATEAEAIADFEQAWEESR